MIKRCAGSVSEHLVRFSGLDCVSFTRNEIPLHTPHQRGYVVALGIFNSNATCGSGYRQPRAIRGNGRCQPTAAVVLGL